MQTAELIDQRVDYWLIQWARWIRQYRPNLGYPTRSPGLITGGESQRWDDYDEDSTRDAWQTNCEALDTLIADLPPSQGAAIRSVYIGEVWRFPRHNMLAQLEHAADSLIQSMDKRGVCL